MNFHGFGLNWTEKCCYFDLLTLSAEGICLALNFEFGGKCQYTTCNNVDYGKAKHFECCHGIKLDCPLWRVSSFFPQQVALSFVVLAVAVGVVVWFPLQISERNRMRKGKGENVAGEEEEKRAKRGGGANGENDQQWKIPACKKLNRGSWNWKGEVNFEVLLFKICWRKALLIDKQPG